MTPRPPETGAAKIPRDTAVEGLRGLAALVVFYHHLMVANLHGWSPPRWLHWPVEASAAVLVFFVLSGYVIGLTNNVEADSGLVRGYIWRRAVRLIPVNTLAVLMACAAAPDWDLPLALSNLLFLENSVEYGRFWFPAIFTNGNLWSLNYEVVYYALFIAVWVFRPRLLLVGALSISVLLAGWYTPFVPLFAACYAAGFLFWIAGLGLARYAKPSSEQSGPWPSYALLALVTWKLQPLHHLLVNAASPSFSGPTVKLYHVAFLPIAVLLVAVAARRTFPLQRTNIFLAVAMATLGLIVHSFLLQRQDTAEFWASFSAYAVALMIWRWKPTLQPLRVCAPIGAISFAFYATARPIEHYVFAHAFSLPANAIGFVVCAVVVTALSLALAWFVERRVQPAIQRTLIGGAKRNRSPLPIAAKPEAARHW